MATNHLQTLRFDLDHCQQAHPLLSDSERVIFDRILWGIEDPDSKWHTPELEPVGDLPPEAFFTVFTGGCLGMRDEVRQGLGSDEPFRVGRFYPVRVRWTPAWIFCPPVVAGAVDPNASRGRHLESGRYIVYDPVFHDAFRPPNSIFRIPESVAIFATPEFVDYVAKRGLKGLEFSPLMDRGHTTKTEQDGGEQAATLSELT